MAYNILYILVEGTDDERFVEHIVVPLIDAKYDCVKVIKYASMKKSKVRQFVRSMEAMGADYFLLGDLDEIECVTRKKDDLLAKYPNVDGKKVFVVVKEIEGWYVAGLDARIREEMGIHIAGETNCVTKERLEIERRRKYNSRIHFLIEMLNRYSVPVGRANNNSLDYLFMKVL